MPTEPVIRIAQIGQEADHGAVLYEIEYEDGTYSFMRQPFRRGAAGQDGNGRWWGWDGTSPITLTPSFVCEDKRHGVRVHLWLKQGRIELCGDSTVRLKETDHAD